MSWFPSLKIKPTIKQTESYWGLLPRFEPSAKVIKQPGTVTSMFGALTHLNSEGGETVSDMAEAKGRSLKLKGVAKVEQLRDKAIKASGNRFEVKDRDGHPRGYFPTQPPANARADECQGDVYDRLEGRIVYSARGGEEDDQYAIPDQGVQSAEVEPTAEEMDW